MPVIGFLELTSPDAFADRLRAFRQGLKDAGYVEGENVAIEYRWADGSNRSAAGAGGRTGSPTGRRDRRDRRHRSAFAAKAATTTIPIVFVVAEDPVRLGLVASLARPGGNLTGINFFAVELAAKRLELLRELVPAAARVAVLVNPANPRDAETTLRDVRDRLLAPWGCKSRSSTPAPAARSMRPSQRFVRERPDALFVGSDPLLHQPACPTGQPGGAPRGPRDLSGRVSLPKSAG